MPTKIEWCDETRNPVKGLCKMGCPYCYARRIYTRFHWDKEVRFAPSVFDGLEKSKPSRIFVGSTHDLMGEWVPAEWIEEIIERCGGLRQHTFLFLSKNPSRYAAFNWPENVCLGATVTNNDDVHRIDLLHEVWLGTKGVRVFVSFEPLLEEIRIGNKRSTGFLSWAIIGGLTPKPRHKPEWIERLLARLDKGHIPVFIKDNARYPEKRQAFPAFPLMESPEAVMINGSSHIREGLAPGSPRRLPTSGGK